MAITGWTKSELYFSDLTVDEADVIIRAVGVGRLDVEVRQMTDAGPGTLSPDAGQIVNRLTLRVVLQNFSELAVSQLWQIINWDRAGRVGPFPV